MNREIVCLLPLIVCAATVLPADALGQAIGIPTNIHVAANARAVFVESMALSTTVRRQADVIAAAAHVQVVVRITMPRLSGARARTTMTKRSGGTMLADVEIPAGSDFCALVAHEFEHILEQIEGLDLAVLVHDPAAGVREVEPGVYETLRAARAERTASTERFPEWDPAAAKVRAVARAVPHRTWRVLRAALRSVGAVLPPSGR